MNDPGIILFGKKIGLPETTTKTTNLPPSHGGLEMEERTNKEKISFTPHVCVVVLILQIFQQPIWPHFPGINGSDLDEQRKRDEANREDELELDDNPKTPSVNEEGMPEKPQTAGTEGDSANSQPKTLKKPDKILPCPRCDSMNTKFCYYNNSNINQPRHFCKSCQRYWTAGGTMRNMPVGAGRRKKKNPPSHCRLIISQEAFGSAAAAAAAAPQIEFAADSDGVRPPPKVLSFGSNSAHVGANLSVASGRVRENGDDCTSGSTVITPNSVVEKIQDNNGFHPQVHWIPGASWSYNTWNPAIPMPIPAICPPGYHPMPIYPSPYWSSGPWLHPAASNFPILGKHSTDREEIRPNEEPKRQKNSVLIPKTLRIDDPDEAAKSSIWATLGIKKDNSSSSSRGDLFKAFQAKGDEKKKHPATEPSPVLQANPAAFSRSSRGDMFKAFQANGHEKEKQPAMGTSPLLLANPAFFRSLCFQERT
ncbi:hypothetical protein OSB04_003229 [Centaurea solstitialis]|uniref:Dof-type domain-containing protein n=1 Tax=Centaurea solstitialis TaxID=347529 RepID=A0AA38UC94_9ASTR|nr:hypothetical protein OSB04_003229 [Centaurea solstitialis]